VFYWNMSLSDGLALKKEVACFFRMLARIAHIVTSKVSNLKFVLYVQ